MISTDEVPTHADAWLSLPWLANGRLAAAQRERLEAHVRTCAECTEELANQRLLCGALAEPDRVTYAPGPSFRKLMDRIDSTRAQADSSTPTAHLRSKEPLWRPPGLAWAASIILAVGLTGIVTTLYRSSNAEYVTHTDAPNVAPQVLHIAFDRSLSVGEATAALRASGARIVEGPDSIGIVGVAPQAANAGASPSRDLYRLAERLRADPRVRWVEPIPSTGP